jgi:hypothetical protein
VQSTGPGIQAENTLRAYQSDWHHPCAIVWSARPLPIARESRNRRVLYRRMCQSPEGRQHSARVNAIAEAHKAMGGETTSLTDHDRLRWRAQGKCYQCLAWFILVRCIRHCGGSSGGRTGRRLSRRSACSKTLRFPKQWRKKSRSLRKGPWWPCGDTNAFATDPLRVPFSSPLPAELCW